MWTWFLCTQNVTVFQISRMAAVALQIRKLRAVRLSWPAPPCQPQTAERRLSPVPSQEGRLSPVPALPCRLRPCRRCWWSWGIVCAAPSAPPPQTSGARCGPGRPVPGLLACSASAPGPSSPSPGGRAGPSARPSPPAGAQSVRGAGGMTAGPPTAPRGPVEVSLGSCWGETGWLSPHARSTDCGTTP